METTEKSWKRRRVYHTQFNTGSRKKLANFIDHNLEVPINIGIKYQYILKPLLEKKNQETKQMLVDFPIRSKWREFSLTKMTIVYLGKTRDMIDCNQSFLGTHLYVHPLRMKSYNIIGRRTLPRNNCNNQDVWLTILGITM